MKELVVISGKGGTGKTSILASLAALTDNAVLADCDVDAADLHLVLEPTVKERHEFRAGHEPRIRQDDCTGCGTCLEHCRFDAVIQTGDDGDDATFTIDPIACDGCKVCVEFCPVEAIDFEEKVCGEWFISETRFGPMVHARLGIAEANSGKLVTVVRGNARRIAAERGLDLLLSDGPPGIGCPVIASITNASMVLVVTEPTLSGIHDLKRVAELATHFQMPMAVAINKCDINPDMSGRIQSVCDGLHVPVVGRVPYDEDVTAAQIQGACVVETSDGPAATAVRSIWLSLRKTLMETE